MFRQCRGFSHDDDSSTGSDYGLERATPEGEEEEEALLIPSSLKESSTESFVLEVVGALGLNVLGEDVDTFCLISNVSASGVSTILHRTDTIDNDTAPIWTLKTKSTCIVKVEKVDPREQLRIELCQRTLGIPGVSDMQIIGGMYLNYSTLLANGDATRREYPIAKEEHPGILLALRFRKASAVDSTTLKQLNEYESDTLLGQSITILSEQLMMKTTGEDHAGDIDFEHVTAKPLLGNSTTVIEGGIPQKAYRVWPFPDADNPKETTFMTKTQIKETALQPSRYWVKASDGAADDYGSIFLEVLGCSNLPNMDLELLEGYTDSFVACIYEDNFVRTPIIHDSFNPRWMPWSHRAFEFQIQHPSSILFLGVFDYDDNPTQPHDPIGRVVIVPSHFEKDTMYTLDYPLYHENEYRGTLTFRLRIQWHNEAEASKAESFARPPRFIINVKTSKAWKILRYLTRGATDMSEVTIESVKLYATEAMEHGQRYCYLLDVLAHLVLWRGKLPIHSFVFFVGLYAAIDFPRFIPSILVLLVAFTLLSNNYYISSHPSRWSRVRSFVRVAVNHYLPSKNPNIVIEPEICEDDHEGKLRDRVDEYRGLRVIAFLYKAMKTALGVYRVYSKNTPLDISTASNSANLFSKLYADYLCYLHVFLRLSCEYIRLLRNFVNWRTGSAYKFVIDCLIFAAAWAVFPYKGLLVRMVLRIVLLAVLGPQNRIIDELWIRPYYRTKEDLMRDGIPTTTEEMKADIQSRPNILDPILSSKWVHEMGKSGRIVVEENLKLQAARELHYGKYSESIPGVDSSRYASVPASSSFSVPYMVQEDMIDQDPIKPAKGTYVDVLQSRKIWSFLSSQSLHGDMIPQAAKAEESLPSEITL